MPSTPPTKNSKKFAVFDIDGTLIRWQLYHAVANELLKQQGNQKLYNDIRAARMRWKQREHALSFRDYELALITAYEAALQNLTVESFNQAVEAVFAEYRDQVYTYTRDLIASLKAQGYILLAISGSQQELVEKIAAYYQFDDYVGTKYLQDHGRFTGEKILGSANKHQVLKQFIAKHHLDLSGSYAVGDSESDISMLQMVAHPIAFNPTQALFETAAKQAWQVVVERKNMVYKLEPHHGSFILG